MSNVIKAQTIRYKEEKRVVDVSQRVKVLNTKIAEAEAQFVSGLQAIALEEQGGEGAEAVLEVHEAEQNGEEAVANEPIKEPAAKEPELTPQERLLIAERQAKEIARIKAELTEAEKVAIRIEVEKKVRTQADIILEQARSQGELAKQKLLQEAEIEKQRLFEAARAEGYEAGETEIEQERMRLQREYAEKTKELEAAFEKKKRDLEPQAVEVVVGLLQSLTGVLLQERKGIVTYLITKALSDTERSGAFLIRVSKEDYEEVKNRLKTIDESMKNSIKYGEGIRILNQDKIEMLFSFIVSQNNNIPRIKGIIEKLCSNLGEKKTFKDIEYYAFPSIEKMASKDEQFYASIGLGYRAKYIKNLAEEIKNFKQTSTFRVTAIFTFTIDNREYSLSAELPYRFENEEDAPEEAELLIMKVVRQKDGVYFERGHVTYCDG